MHFVSGMPVRAAFLEIDELPDADREALELTIVGGSLGAAVFATMVPDALAQVDSALRARLRVTQQCRAEQVDMLQARYREIGINAKIRTFFDDMPDRFAKSDLVISRAGASSVAELAASGRPAILIPFAGAMDDHQTANARQLEAAGGGICLAEAELDAAMDETARADCDPDADVAFVTPDEREGSITLTFEHPAPPEASKEKEKPAREERPRRKKKESAR